MNSLQYIKMVTTVSEQIAKRKDQYEIPALSRLRGEISIRVHNRGENDEGKTRAYKSRAYVKKYNKKDPVSMVKDGDLKRDYAHYIDGDDNVLGFRQDLSIKKILSEEKRRGGNLFLPNEEEIAITQRSLVRFINRLQRNIINGY